MARVDITVRMGRQSRNRASSRRNTDWLEHIRWVYVALRATGLFLLKSNCWYGLASEKKNYLVESQKIFHIVRRYYLLRVSILSAADCDPRISLYLNIQTGLALSQ